MNCTEVPIYKYRIFVTVLSKPSNLSGSPFFTYHQFLKGRVPVSYFLDSPRGSSTEHLTHQRSSMKRKHQELLYNSTVTSYIFINLESKYGRNAKELLWLKNRGLHPRRPLHTLSSPNATLPPTRKSLFYHDFLILLFKASKINILSVIKGC